MSNLQLAEMMRKTIEQDLANIPRDKRFHDLIATHLRALDELDKVICMLSYKRPPKIFIPSKV